MQISGSAFSAGLSGIQAGQRRVDQAAGEIAGNTLPVQRPDQTPPAQQVEPSPEARTDLAESLVGLTQGRNEVQASARVVETADEVLGTLIDTRA
ncbi:hypothetical protein [Pseudomonas sp. Gutcm_11s]|uniref:hypothetical protein n=1 Tax=Pseudomonas sp. Gutcm_11s TaxID=3026088 RepID=UPI002361E27C|nr:hypothetical protein [Pseudomonas sp. Gutcm_11s]MDD0845278.1 hypothetical protein [Pseudomonas sp. Gutcm_11s]